MLPHARTTVLEANRGDSSFAEFIRASAAIMRRVPKVLVVPRAPKAREWGRGGSWGWTAEYDQRMRGERIWLRFLSGLTLRALGSAARRSSMRMVRVHLIPDNGGAGHFSVLRGMYAADAGTRLRSY